MPPEYYELRRALHENAEFERDVVLFQNATRLRARRPSSRESVEAFLGEVSPEEPMVVSVAASWRINLPQQRMSEGNRRAGRQDGPPPVPIGMVISRSGAAWGVLYTVSGATAAEFGNLVGKSYEQADLPVKFRAVLRNLWLQYHRDPSTVLAYLKPEPRGTETASVAPPAPTPPAEPKAPSPEPSEFVKQQVSQLFPA